MHFRDTDELLVARRRNLGTGRRQLNPRRSDAVNILFVASVAVIVPSPGTSRRLFLDTLGLPLTQRAGDEYHFSKALKGTKHFGICGIWALSQAAEGCFGSREWPASRPVPTACVEFEVADERSVYEAAKELRSAGTSCSIQSTRKPGVKRRASSSAFPTRRGCIRKRDADHPNARRGDDMTYEFPLMFHSQGVPL